jgi:hypothetical protein
MYEDHNARAVDFATYKYISMPGLVLYNSSDYDCLFLPD